MPMCQRRGCGVVFDPAVPSTCTHHPGAPKFHEGSKSWTCCESVNKPVLDFDDFMAIAGCTTVEAHTTEKQEVPGGATTAPSTSSASSKDASGKETYGASTTITPLTGSSLSAAQGAATGAASSNTKKPEAPMEEADPDDAQIPEDASCKRKGCGGLWTADDARKGPRRREAEVCRYHRGVAIFHEGSKGWSCCKPRVLDFDDFLAIAPCTTSNSGHLFVGAPRDADAADASEEEVATCRLDHYETPTDVRLTVYAKGVDIGRSTVRFASDAVHFSLALPPIPPPTGSGRPRRFERQLAPFADIEPDASSFVAGKFKIDVVLAKKQKGASWPSLERGDQVVGYGVTFGRQ